MAQFTISTEPAGVVWYRIVDGRYAAMLDEFERPVGRGQPYTTVWEFEVERDTPKGVWLRSVPPFGAPRFVLRDARKRYACPTIEEAWESFRARKTKQLAHLRRQIAHVEAVIELPKPRWGSESPEDLSEEVWQTP